MLKKTFPHYTQLNSSDCGPTCLRMIASFYGKEYSQETIRRHCFISREGVYVVKQKCTTGTSIKFGILA